MKSKVSRTQPVKIQDFVSNHIHQTITNWENLQSLLASLLVPKPLNNEQETLKILGTDPSFTHHSRVYQRWNPAGCKKKKKEKQF